MTWNTGVRERSRSGRSSARRASKRDVLMGVGAQCGLPDLREQLAETGVPGQIAAQG